MRALEISGRRISLAIEPSFWLVMGFFAFSSGGGSPAWVLELFAAIVLSLLVHEGGHAGVVLLFGGDARIRLHALGGETAHKLKLPSWKQFVVTFSGPLAGAAAAALAYGLARLILRQGRADAGLVAFLIALVNINVLWSAVNLLPILPMDGGKLLAIVLQPRFGNAGLKFVHGLGILLGTGLALACLATGQTWNAAIFGLFAVGGLQSWRALSRRTPEDDDPALQNEFEEAQKLALAGRGQEALPRLIALRRRAGRGRIFEATTEVLGRQLAATGQKGAAVELLSSVESQLSYPSRVLLAALLNDGGDHDRALAVGKSLFLQKRDPAVACLCAAACAAKGESAAAIEWLRSALRGGLADPVRRLSAKEFDSLRGLPEFQELESAARNRG